MTVQKSTFLRPLLVIITTIPVLLFAYLGSFSRMMSDDYCTMAIGQQYGVWEGTAYWLSTWTGSYTNFFIKSGIAPLDTFAPTAAIWLTLIVWFVAIFIFLWQLSKYAGTIENRVFWITIITTTLIFGTVNALYSLQSYYWFAANIPYTLPLGLLTLYGGLVIRLARVQTWHRGAWVGLVISGAICLIIAGASEIILAFQVAFLVLICGMILLFITPPYRNRYLAIVGFGTMLTLSSFIMQILSPGIQNRLTTEGNNIDRQLTSINEIVPETLKLTFEYIGHNEAFAGFMVVFCVTLIMVFILYKPSKSSALPNSGFGIPIRYMWVWLVVQGLYMPILWGHHSDNLQVLGRYSYGYFVIIMIHVIFMIASLAIVLRHRWLNSFINRYTHSWTLIFSSLAYIIVGLFCLTQLRSIHFIATNYLFVNTLLLLGGLLWQLSKWSSVEHIKRITWAFVAWHGVIVILISAIVFTALYGRGFVTPRILTPASYLLVSLGFLWGLYLGSLIKSFLINMRIVPIISLSIRGLISGLILSISIGITLGHASQIPDLQLYGREWDMRHAYIITTHADGAEQIEVSALRFDLANMIQVVTLATDPANRCAEQYYGVDSIIVKNSP